MSPAPEPPDLPLSFAPSPRRRVGPVVLMLEEPPAKRRRVSGWVATSAVVLAALALAWGTLHAGH